MVRVAEKSTRLKGAGLYLLVHVQAPFLKVVRHGVIPGGKKKKQKN